MTTVHEVKATILTATALKTVVLMLDEQRQRKAVLNTLNK